MITVFVRKQNVTKAFLISALIGGVCLGASAWKELRVSVLAMSDGTSSAGINVAWQKNLAKNIDTIWSL